MALGGLEPVGVELLRQSYVSKGLNRFERIYNGSRGLQVSNVPRPDLTSWTAARALADGSARVVPLGFNVKVLSVLYR